MRLADFDFELPDELIAQYPAADRRASRLLVVDARANGTGRLDDRRFAELPALLEDGDLLVFNDTRVLKARLRGRKSSGGRVEVLVERVDGDTAVTAQIRASRTPRSGTVLELPGGCEARVVGRDRDLFRLELSTPAMVYLEVHGEVPLPPYLGRAPEAGDEERYQTVYARTPGAVAAPTAGLHFDAAMLAETEALGVRHAYVTLHVGAGTFKALRAERVEDNHLHAERVVVDGDACRAVAETRARGSRVVAVGTTAVRALETASASGELEPFAGETDLFIVPGYAFRQVDAMLTNFHLPKSSLLILVSAFAGTECMLEAYRHAIDRRYRFFSYGDAMLILPRARRR